MAFAGQGDTSSCSFLDNLASCWLDVSNATSSTGSFFSLSSEFQSYELGDSNTVRGDSMDYLTSEEQMTASSLMMGAEYQVEGLICSKDGENENEPKEATVLSDHTSEAKRKSLEPENGNSTESPKKKKAHAQVRIELLVMRDTFGLYTNDYSFECRFRKARSMQDQRRLLRKMLRLARRP